MVFHQVAKNLKHDSGADLEDVFSRLTFFLRKKKLCNSLTPGHLHGVGVLFVTEFQGLFFTVFNEI